MEGYVMEGRPGKTAEANRRPRKAKKGEGRQKKRTDGWKRK